MHFCYSLGALVNFYSHTLLASPSGVGAAGTLVPDYILYGLNDKIHPRLWSANARDIWQWWRKRSPSPGSPGPSIQSTYSTSGNLALAWVFVSGAQDDRTAVEILVPGNGSARLHGPGFKVFRDGVRTLTDFRTDGQTIRVLVGTSYHMVLVEYWMLPRARDDTYIVAPGATIAAASGVLTNDTSPSGATLTAHNCSDTTHFTLNSNGSVVCPSTLGQYTFTYQATDGTNDSLPATVSVLVTPSSPYSAYLVEDFNRTPTDADTLGAWTKHQDPNVSPPIDGDWIAAEGVLRGASGWDLLNLPNDGHYGVVYHEQTWSPNDYSVEARISFQANAYGGGVGGRVDASTGTRYVAWIYPEGSPDGDSNPLYGKIELAKYSGWKSYAGSLGSASISFGSPAVGTNWHAVKLVVHASQISAYFDGKRLVTAGEDAPYSSGGVSLDMWTSPEKPANMLVDDVVVSPLIPRLQILMPGETAVANSVTGKTGTPTTRTHGVPFTVTVNAVDVDWNLISSITDVVHLSSSDTSATLPANAALVGGTATFSVTLGSAGTWTITASDVSDSQRGSDTGTPVPAQ